MIVSLEKGLTEPLQSDPLVRHWLLSTHRDVGDVTRSETPGHHLSLSFTLSSEQLMSQMAQHICVRFKVRHLDVVHHLQIKVIFGALQNQSAAHVGRRVVEVKDNIVGLRASFGPKYPVDLLGSLHLVGQVISFWGTTYTHRATFIAYQTGRMKHVNDLTQGCLLDLHAL